jgi:hypothetical protein
VDSRHHAGAEFVAVRGADRGNIIALNFLAGIRKKAGETVGAEALDRQAVPTAAMSSRWSSSVASTSSPPAGCTTTTRGDCPRPGRAEPISVDVASLRVYEYDLHDSNSIITGRPATVMSQISSLIDPIIVGEVGAAGRRPHDPGAPP